MATEAALPCPGCGFMVLAGSYGSYDICEFCGWEDDCVQLANPTSGGGANHRSLHEVQLAALTRYPLDVREFKSMIRSDRWRPLSQEEVQRFNQQRELKHWHSQAILDETDAYWSRAV
jgi:hypothetical protein